jgi:hypothetical protein
VLHGFDPQIVFYRINCTAANGASFIGFEQKLHRRWKRILEQFDPLKVRFHFAAKRVRRVVTPLIGVRGPT